MQGKIWVMITLSRQSAERFSQNSARGAGSERGCENQRPAPQPLRAPQLAVFCLPAPTFDLVGGCGPHLSLTVLHQVLEGRDQVCLGDLRPHCFLELHKEKWSGRPASAQAPAPEAGAGPGNQSALPGLCWDPRQRSSFPLPLKQNESHPPAPTSTCSAYRATAERLWRATAGTVVVVVATSFRNNS